MQRNLRITSCIYWLKAPEKKNKTKKNITSKYPCVIV